MDITTPHPAPKQPSILDIPPHLRGAISPEAWAAICKADAR